VVGDGRLGATRCTQVVDMRGRTVVPGLIDNHNHVVLLGLRPRHDTRLESAASIDDVLALLKARAASRPAGEWITSIGGLDTNQFGPAPGVPRFRRARPCSSSGAFVDLAPSTWVLMSKGWPFWDVQIHSNRRAERRQSDEIGSKLSPRWATLEKGHSRESPARQRSWGCLPGASADLRRASLSVLVGEVGHLEFLELPFPFIECA
jgi:hypothetical protein